MEKEWITDVSQEEKPIWHTPAVERIEMKKTLMPNGSGVDGVAPTHVPD